MVYTACPGCGFYRSLGICRPFAFVRPCGSGVFAAWFLLRKKDHYEAKAPQSCGTGWNLEGGASDRKWLCPSGISRKRQPAFGKSFYWGEDGASVFVFP